ncbi:MAG: hypothetical protein AAGG38_13690 [Planctomycetota bacterium]
MSTPLPILFTVFEHSGDALAARLIQEIKRREPGRPVVGFGGPQMEAAGAELIEESIGHSKMGLGAVSQAKELLRRKGVLKAWLAENELAALVPTDSPAANWSMCAAVRKARPEAKIVHLAGPQLWGWASWRIRKLRRLTDHVMCLLPFEPEWFGSRGVASTFVGHPLFQADAAAAGPPLANDGEPLKAGDPKLALLPGSRVKEIALNWPTMLKVYDQIRHRLPGLAVTVAAADGERARQIHQMCPGGRPPRGIQVSVGEAQSTLDWADAALIVSGTATLQAVSRGTPTVVLYNANMWLWNTVGRALIRSRTFALPNVISEAMELGRVMPELVPHDGAPEPVAAALMPLLKDDTARAAQREAFAAIAGVYEGRRFREAAADVLLGELGQSTARGRAESA